MKSRRIITIFLAVAPLITCVGCQKRWTGTWQDSAPGHKGELYCAVRQVDAENYKARFTGYCGKQFAYDITMKGHTVADTILFEGEADLGDDDGTYQWTGTIRGDRFDGQYRSVKGREGSFTMTQR